MTATEAARTHIRQTLVGDSSVTDLVEERIFSSLAPSGTAMPYVTFHLESPRDEMIGGDTIAVSVLIYLVKATVEGEDEDSAEAIAAAVHAALHGSQSSQDGFTVDAHRVAPWAMPVVDGSRQFRQVGGRYRLLVRPSI